MKKIIPILGAILVLAGAAILIYGNPVPQQPAALGAENAQGTSVNYMAFFGFALGGGGILILLFSFFQWYAKRRPK